MQNLKRDVRSPYTYLSGNCKICGQEQIVIVQSVDLAAYDKGVLAQHAFHYLSPGDREFLISGWCEACFDRLTATKE